MFIFPFPNMGLTYDENNRTLHRIQNREPKTPEQTTSYRQLRGVSLVRKTSCEKIKEMT